MKIYIPIEVISFELCNRTFYFWYYQDINLDKKNVQLNETRVKNILIKRGI